MTDPLTDLANLTGMAKQNLLFFSRNNSISYAQIKTFYITNSRMPTVAECSQIKVSNGSTFGVSN